ncbi:glycosyltransferase family 4 protein [Pseudalkalibacillus sp. NRS-1564]|uniref:glycosyltransferase family 4 protein n=1 Tax=Pseudalkalibacillus sp. NRS-1564 TaxID=3233900 RepID=UPI003D2E3D80
MNITIFIGGLSGGGAERVVCNLSNFLSARHNVTVLTMSNDTPAYQLNRNVKRVSLIKNRESNNFIGKNFKRIIRFQNYIKNADADVYLVMLPGTINIMLAHRNLIKVPVIVSERCDPQARYESSKLRKWLMKKLYPKAEGFVFQTKDAMSYYSEIIRNRGIVIPNAINHEFVRESFKGKRKKRIVSVGRFTDQKNFKLLIKAFSRITDKYPDYDLIIYGNGPQKNQLVSLVKELKLENKVMFPGYVEKIGDHIIDASLFVLPSNYEGMPNALMEAMALGLPSISTDCPVGGPNFLINDKENGLLVPVNEVEKLSNAMEKILSNEAFAFRIGENARNISETLNSDIIYGQWESYIKEFL